MTEGAAQISMLLENGMGVLSCVSFGGLGSKIRVPWRSRGRFPADLDSGSLLRLRMLSDARTSMAVRAQWTLQNVGCCGSYDFNSVS